MAIWEEMKTKKYYFAGNVKFKDALYSFRFAGSNCRYCTPIHQGGQSWKAGKLEGIDVFLLVDVNC